MALAKLSTLAPTWTGPGLDAGWVNSGAAVTVAGNGVSLPATTGFATNIHTTTALDPTSSAIYGKFLLPVPEDSVNAPIGTITLTAGGSHTPTVDLIMEFDYTGVLCSVRSNFSDDGNGVTATPVVGRTMWWRIKDDGTNVLWQVAVDGVSWVTLRSSARPAWWNGTDGVLVTVGSHSATGTASPLVVSNINGMAHATATDGPPDIAIFDSFNVPASVPGNVTGLTAHVTGNVVALTWTAPPGPVNGYTVTANPLNSSSPALASQNTPSTAASFFGLVNASSYTFTVRAYNSAGTATASATTSAVTISTTGAGGGTGGGTGGTGGGTGGGTTPPPPVPSVVNKLANALPVVVQPGSYGPMLLSSDPDDGDTLANKAVQRLADLLSNDWRPYLGHVEVALLQVASYIAADLRSLVRDSSDQLFTAYGTQVLGVPQRWASPSQIITTWTASDTAGHVVPAGTQVSYPGAGSTPVTFTLRGDLEIPAGSASVANVVMLCDETGAVTNQVPTGALEIQTSIVWLASVTVTTAASGGQDAEGDIDYRNRLVAFTRTLGQQLVLPADYSLAAQQADTAVVRAYTVANFDATHPTLHPERTVSVYLLGANGLPVGDDVALTVQAALAARREVNFNVVVLDGSGHTIKPTYVSVVLTVTVTAQPGFDNATVHDSVLAMLTDFLSPANWAGADQTPPAWTGSTILRPHDISTVINQVPGVAHIDALAITGAPVKITGSDNYQLAPTSLSTAVLPAGLYTDSHWPTVSTITVTVNSPGYAA